MVITIRYHIMIRQGVTSAVTSAKNAVVKTSTNFRNDWQSGINQLKESGTVGKRFAAYSEGVVNNLDNIAVGTIQLARDPLGTINESVNIVNAINKLRLLLADLHGDDAVIGCARQYK